MSADFETGDLVVCVDAAPRPSSDLDNLLKIEEGRTYKVRAVVCYGLGVQLVGVSNNRRSGYWADRFRKVEPPKHEPCEAEFVTLLKRSKRPVHITIGESA